MALSHGFQRVVFNEADITTAFELVAAIPKKIIRVRGVVVGSDASNLVELLSDAASILPFRASVDGPSTVLQFTEGGVGEAWAICVAEEALNIIASVAQPVYGVVFWDTINV